MNDKIIVLAVAAALALLAVSSTVAQQTPLPVQGEGALSQSPLNLGTGATPAFIMAVDDSGSMLYQTMFPGANGQACWSDSSDSFFVEDSKGKSTEQLRTSGSCSYQYVVPGPRNNPGSTYSIPPLDTLGFARSPDFNPSYFDPDVTYEPWVDSDLLPYEEANRSETRIHPDRTETVKLFSALKSTDWTFRIRNGMVIPKNTNYNLRDRCTDRDRRGNCTDWDWGNWREASNAISWNSGSEEIAIEHEPGVVYLKENRSMPGYASGNEVQNACGEGCSLWKYQPSSSDARQNFANWFSFYGNRNRAMIAGMTRALQDVDKLRVGYLTINKHGSWDQPLTRSAERVTMFDMSDSTAKASLYSDQLLKLPASGNTPNLPAVNAAGQQFKRIDRGAPVAQVCQKNSVMLFTDGYSNISVDIDNQDGNMGVPFRDSHADTLADIATSFYLDSGNGSPIRPDLTPAGRVPVPAGCEGPNPDPKLDCQSNLHVNFYGITLGATGDLFDPDKPIADQDPYTTASIYNNWPGYDGDDPSTIDDIWHATVNTRGKFINATTPADIANAMRDVLSAVSADAGQAGSLAVSGARLGDDSFSVAPEYGVNGTDWFGDLVASGVEYAGGQFTRTQTWSAAQQLAARVDQRNIMFATTGSDSTPDVSSFATVNAFDVLCDVNDPLVTTACANIGSLGVSVSEAVGYLAGDDTHEGGRLRARTSPLGDIVNSTPVVSSPRDNHGYTTLMPNPNGGEADNDPLDYADYLESKADRATMVYVGANDGMLHGFNHANGSEEFAYIPATSIGHMGNLLFPAAADFEHRYYVDGPINVSDAYYSGAWHTVLVGTSGAGGRSVFGLDVGNPTAFTAGQVLWEVNDRIQGADGQQTAAAERMGHVTGRPVVVPVRERDGSVSWKAIFGNGAGSERGNAGVATLFMVDIETGETTFIDAEEAAAPRDIDGNIRPNGLTSIIAVDRQQVLAGNEVSAGSDGFMDEVYGGDLHGNIWKFNLLTNEVVYGQPLFTAEREGMRQPITGGLEAALGANGGVMLLFGTGSFMFENDKVRNEVQSIYGILDAGEVVAGRDSLQEQTIDQDTNFVSKNDVDYYSQSGWYLDLDTTMLDSSGTTVASGERMVSRPRLDNGVFWFTTFAPSSADPCAGGGSNWMYGLSALTGGANMDTMRDAKGDNLDEGTGRVDLVSDGSAPIMDIGVFTTGPLGNLVRGEEESDADFEKRYLERLDSGRCDVIIQAQGAEPLFRWRACGRQSWRQIR